MDQEKIGVFISTLRKEQGMTQQQLADAIGVSNKTISKWECGKGMPELALIVPLCHILQISINEFLSGEHLLENGYTEKAEVNMMNLLQETENSKKKSRSSLLAFGITVIIFLFVVLYSVITNMGISMNMLFVDMPTLLSMFLVTALFLLGTNLGLPFFDSFRIILEKEISINKTIVSGKISDKACENHIFGNGIPRKLYQLYGNSTYGGRNTSFYRIKYFHFNCIKWNFIWINWFSAITANSGKVRNNVYAEAGR